MRAEPRRLGRVPVAGVVPAVALPVAGDGLVRLLQLEVGAGGVEEQQVHLQVQQVRDLVEDLLLQVVLHLVEPVHRPVAGLLSGLGQRVDMHVVGDPLGSRELRGGGQRAVGDQREQHPLGRGHVPGPAPLGLPDPGHDLVDLQSVPQVVQDVGAAERDRAGELQPRRGVRGQGLAGLQQARQGRDQAPDRVAVQLVLPAEGEQHLRHGPALDRVPLVVGQVQVPHRPGLVLPFGRPHIHDSRPYGTRPGQYR